MNKMVKDIPTEAFRGGLCYGLVGVILPYELLQKEFNVSGKHIVVFMGDGGGANAALPVIPHALAAGCHVALYLVGTCAMQHQAGTRTFDKGVEVYVGTEKKAAIDDFFADRQCDLLVICASHAQVCVEAGRNIMDKVDLVPILGIQDMYGSLHPYLVEGGDFYFDTICVSEGFSKNLMVVGFPNTADAVVVTGNPYFDSARTVKATWNTRRQSLRDALGITDEHVAFLIVGGLNGTAELLELAEQGIVQAGISNKAKLILRTHPRATREDQDLITKYLKSHPRDWFIDVDASIAPTSDSLLSGIDFVLSGYTTTNYLAILYEMGPKVVYVGTPAIKRDLRNEKKMAQPPEVACEAAWYVQTPTELTNIITSPSAATILRMTFKQSEIAQYNDGQATLRVWQQMQYLLDV